MKLVKVSFINHVIHFNCHLNKSLKNHAVMGRWRTLLLTKQNLRLCRDILKLRITIEKNCLIKFVSKMCKAITYVVTLLDWGYYCMSNKAISCQVRLYQIGQRGCKYWSCTVLCCNILKNQTVLSIYFFEVKKLKYFCLLQATKAKNHIIFLCFVLTPELFGCMP